MTVPFRPYPPPNRNGSRVFKKKFSHKIAGDGFRQFFFFLQFSTKIALFFGKYYNKPLKIPIKNFNVISPDVLSIIFFMFKWQ